MEKEKNLTNRYHTPSLIVMLTHEDQTVQNAYEIFDAYKDSDAEYWGFKEEPLPLSQMKDLYAYMKSCGKKTEWLHIHRRSVCQVQKWQQNVAVIF